MPEKIYFHGAGLITTLGGNLRENLDAIGRLRSPVAPPPITCKVQDRELATPYFLIADPGLACGTTRLHRIVDNVVSEALETSGLTAGQRQKMGLFVGSTSFDIYNAELAIQASSRSDKDIASHIPPFPNLADYIREKFDLDGPVFTFNTACTSSANALMYAAESIRCGDIEQALVVGLEFYNETTALGFWGLELLSRNGMRPFSSERDGLYLGEGCGALLISRQPAAHGFGYLGGANAGDNHSVTGCNPDGSTIAAVIGQALEEAEVVAGDIRLVKAHGTASLSNDEAEAAGLQRVFSTVPPVVVLKPVIGHTLGACGINELILFYQSLLSGKPLNPCAFAASDPFRLRLADDTDRPDRGPFLLNYFGFGGNNTAMIIGNE